MVGAAVPINTAPWRVSKNKRLADIAESTLLEDIGYVFSVTANYALSPVTSLRHRRLWIDCLQSNAAKVVIRTAGCGFYVVGIIASFVPDPLGRNPDGGMQVLRRGSS